MQDSWFSVTKRRLFAFAIVTKSTQQNTPDKSFGGIMPAIHIIFLGEKNNHQKKIFLKTLRKSDNLFPNWTVGHHHD